MADSTYENQAKVYMKQGANELVVANSGSIKIEAGGFFNADSQTVSPEMLAWGVISPMTVAHYSGSAMSGAVLSNGHGYHDLALAASESTIVMTIPAPSGSGAVLTIVCPNAAAGFSALLSTTTASTMLPSGSTMSSISFNAVTERAVFMSSNGSQWSIVDYTGATVNAG